ncbi:MAG: zinc ribbon domain-containing protein [Thaumarchaeota archaeon]|nr:zinc ribbon domain-containing protein [Nitrososphaerota archaeon]
MAVTLGILSVVLLDSLVQNPLFQLFGSAEFFLGTAFFAIVLGIVAIIQFTIASALLSGKNWGRTAIIIFVIIDLIFETISLFVGNVLGIIFLILDIIILYYMWRPHVIAYFKGVNVQPAQQYYNPGFSQNPPPYVPPSAKSNNQYSKPSPPPPDPSYINDETEIYPEDSIIGTNIPPQKICQKCQAEVSPKAKFCGKCGNWI